MKRRDSETAGAALACDSCGQLPHPEKVRLTLANVAAMLPIELLVHAAVVHAALPYVLKVLVLTVTATVLVIWVAEPSARHALRGWLHAPALRHRCRLRSSPSLWHIHALADNPDGQQKLAETISKAGAEILIQQSRGVAGAVLGELVVGAPDHVTHADLSIHGCKDAVSSFLGDETAVDAWLRGAGCLCRPVRLGSPHGSWGR